MVALWRWDSAAQKLAIRVASVVVHIAHAIIVGVGALTAHGPGDTLAGVATLASLGDFATLTNRLGCKAAHGQAVGIANLVNSIAGAVIVGVITNRYTGLRTGCFVGENPAFTILVTAATRHHAALAFGIDAPPNDCPTEAKLSVHDG